MTRQTTSLKTELNTLVDELGTGQKSDLTQHLGARSTELLALDRKLNLTDRLSSGNLQTLRMLESVQTSLSRIDDLRSNTSLEMLAISDTSSVAQIENASRAARSAFDGTIATLNTRFGDQSLFAGQFTDGASLASSDIIFAELNTTIAGLTNAADVSSAIDNWFASGGGFDTVAYSGDPNGFVSRTISTGEDLSLDVRADDQAFRDVLAAFAKAALATGPGTSLSTESAADLQQISSTDLLSSTTGLTALQARVGASEARVESITARLGSERTAMSIARNDLISADPFETASRLEKLQLQLETQFTLTARLSRLSLTEYLR
ncbi:MAG: flagellin [Pseudomonadota bacterium]